MILLAVLLTADLGIFLGASQTDIDLLNKLANLDTPALLIVFIALLARRKLIWRGEFDERIAGKDEELKAWRAAASERVEEAERGATIAEQAIIAGLRRQRS